MQSSLWHSKRVNRNLFDVSISNNHSKRANPHRSGKGVTQPFDVAKKLTQAEYANVSIPAQGRMRLELHCRYAALPACLALVVFAATACRSTPAPPAPPQLLPRETFDW